MFVLSSTMAPARVSLLIRRAEYVGVHFMQCVYVETDVLMLRNATSRPRTPLAFDDPALPKIFNSDPPTDFIFSCATVDIDRCELI